MLFPCLDSSVKVSFMRCVKVASVISCIFSPSFALCIKVPQTVYDILWKVKRARTNGISANKRCKFGKYVNGRMGSFRWNAILNLCFSIRQCPGRYFSLGRKPTRPLIITKNFLKTNFGWNFGLLNVSSNILKTF